MQRVILLGAETAVRPLTADDIAHLPWTTLRVGEYAAPLGLARGIGAVLPDRLAVNTVFTHPAFERIFQRCQTPARITRAVAWVSRRGTLVVRRHL